jgi:hypothetical protein
MPAYDWAGIFAKGFAHETYGGVHVQRKAHEFGKVLAIAQRLRDVSLPIENLQHRYFGQMKARAWNFLQVTRIGSGGPQADLCHALLDVLRSSFGPGRAGFSAG